MRITNDDNDTSAALAKIERKIDALAADVRAMQRHFFWQRVWSITRTLLILIPLVWGAIAVYPFVQGFYEQYKELFEQTNAILRYGR